MSLHFHHESFDDLVLLLDAVLVGTQVLARLSTTFPPVIFRWRVVFQGHDLLMQHLDLPIHALIPVNDTFLGFTQSLYLAYLSRQLHLDLLSLGRLHL